jgi:hypothetical protein
MSGRKQTTSLRNGEYARPLLKVLKRQAAAHSLEGRAVARRQSGRLACDESGGSSLQVPAGQCAQQALSVAVRATRRMDASVHGRIADSVAAEVIRSSVQPCHLASDYSNTALIDSMRSSRPMLAHASRAAFQWRARSPSAESSRAKQTSVQPMGLGFWNWLV